jgi:hypothetical protein
MAYTKTIWSTGDTITATLANHGETQYDEAIGYVDSTGAGKQRAYDKRSLQTVPFREVKNGSRFDFKFNTSLNLPSGNGTYTGVMTYAGWGDPSGGSPHQVSFPTSGRVYQRYGLADSKPTWVASTAYALNDLRMPTSANENGIYYKCTTAGTSGSTEPTWPTTIGATVTDGTAVWTAEAKFWSDWVQLADKPMVDDHANRTDNPHNVTVAQIGAEPAFTKNNAFNKNFGTAAGTVAQGDHSHTAASIGAAEENMAERNAYDDYALWFELYNKGYITQGETIGAKSLTFDGFQDTNNVNTGSSTAVVNTSNKIVYPSESGTRQVIPTTHTDWPGNNATNDADWTSTTRANTKDGSTSTYFEVSIGGSSVKYYSHHFDLGEAQVIKGLALTGSDTWGGTRVELTDCQVSMDGVNWTSVSVNTNFVSALSTTFKVITLPSATYGRYIRFKTKCLNTNGSATTFRISETQLQVATFSLSSNLRGKTKSVPFTAKKVKLYVTSNIKTNATLTPKIAFDGSTFGNMILVTSRTDPRFPGFTEYEYKITGSGSTLVLDLILATSNSNNAAVVKRYGLHIQ